MIVSTHMSFSFWCLGVVSFWSGVLKRHRWPHMGVEVRAGLSRLRCSTPDMLQNWYKRQTWHIRAHMAVGAGPVRRELLGGNGRG